VSGTVIGLVPARAGSKGIPGKNLAPVAGRPLLAWTIDAALGSPSLDRVVVSTDGEEIAETARGLGADVLDRPADLAGDETPMAAVVLHALEELGDCEALAVLQPTSPLRRPEHVEAAVALLRSSGADTVVSVVQVPHAHVPSALLRLDEGRLVPLERGASATLRQHKPVLYARNGPAVLVVRPEPFRQRGELYGGDMRALLMDPRDSLDVDTAFDLELAELLLR
jgi:CMP-N-acetylneuraminic acid synthetase